MKRIALIQGLTVVLLAAVLALAWVPVTTAGKLVNTGTFGAMQARFDGQAGAFAYLLFILLYFPCVAATAAVYRETGMGWTIFVAAWTTGLAYMAATIFYQTATFAQHPISSGAWIGGFLAAFVAFVLALGRWSRGPRAAGLPLPEKA